MKSSIQLFSLIALFVCTIGSLNAQSLDFGLKAGANFSNFSDANSLDLDTRTGVTAGVFVAARFNMLSIQGELLYSQQGSDSDLLDVDFDYIQLPLLVKLHFLRVLNLQAGPQFGYLVNYDDIESSDKLDVGLAIGLGAHLGDFRIDARYNLGFKEYTFDSISSPKNEFFSFAVGYTLF